MNDESYRSLALQTAALIVLLVLILIVVPLRLS